MATILALGFAYRAEHEKRERLIEQERAEAELREEQQRSRSKLLEEKIRNAYLVAASGDFKQTEDTIKEIETLGGSTGQVRLLRGMAAYFRGDSGMTASELEQAINLMPESATAHALLAVSYVDYGKWEESAQVFDEMSRIAPSSPEDYIFRGYAYEYIDPGQGLPDLDEGLRRHDSALGRALRTFGRSNKAIETAKEADTQEALLDAHVARVMLPNNPLVLSASLFAHTCAAGIYQELGLVKERETVLDEANQEVRALETFGTLPIPAFMVWTFFEAIDDREHSLEIARKSADSSQGTLGLWAYAIELYRANRFTEALAYLDKRTENGLLNDTMRAIILAEMPDGSRLAFEEYQKLIRKYSPTRYDDVQFSSIIPLLLGKVDIARAAVRKSIPAPSIRSERNRALFKATQEFGSGDLSEEQFLGIVGSSRLRQVTAHFRIGLSRLAVGDRDMARVHLKKAVDSHSYWAFDFFLSQMFLTRMNNDRNWPPWIPPKKDQSTP